MKIKTNYKEIINEELNGIELYFETIPTKQEREELKANGYKWHSLKKCWYIKKDKQTKQKEKTISKKQPKNYLGIKKGDIFYSSWGYEQTNVNFFQVAELKGSTQVILQEVYLKIKKEDAISGMSSDRSYDEKTATPAKTSVFVKDNIKGMIKKILGTKEKPYINLTSFANAYLYDGSKLYESWYY